MELTQLHRHTSNQANWCYKTEMKKGLQERELHLSIPQGSRNNPVTSSQPRRKSNKEKESASEKEEGGKKRSRGKRGRKQRRGVQYVREGGRKKLSGNVRKERHNSKRRGGGQEKRNAAESFRWKLLEWEDHDCSLIWTPPAWITANPAADIRTVYSPHCRRNTWGCKEPLTMSK